MAEQTSLKANQPPDAEKHFCRSITVFAGSAVGLHPVYAQAAYGLGKIIALQGRTLVYGGGRTGLMGAVAEGALSHGGQVIGVINEVLNLPNLSHSGLSRLEIVSDIQIRKARLIELGDAMIALPGGFGTLDEIFETLTGSQIGLHRKPLGFLNTVGYYEPLLKTLSFAMAESFIFPAHRHLYMAQENPLLLLTDLDNFVLPENLNAWLDRNE
ncbi:MAG: TIGR00730 family Rossman fold protein [Anaerolineaceae bacterium]|nr:TIGR00730 family Rossman fold protein [Anaerolineaceae bacterium]